WTLPRSCTRGAHCADAGWEYVHLRADPLFQHPDRGKLPDHPPDRKEDGPPPAGPHAVLDGAARTAHRDPGTHPGGSHSGLADGCCRGTLCEGPSGEGESTP